MRPKIRVSPEATKKISMPIASPATVRVSHARGSMAASGSSRSSAAPTARGRTRLIPPASYPEVLLLEVAIGGQRGHRSRVDGAAVVHHVAVVAEPARHGEVLLHQHHGGLPFHGLERRDQVLDHDRREALKRETTVVLVEQNF